MWMLGGVYVNIFPGSSHQEAQNPWYTSRSDHIHAHALVSKMLFCTERNQSPLERRRIPGLGQWKDKMSQEHLVVLTSKTVLKNLRMCRKSTRPTWKGPLLPVSGLPNTHAQVWPNWRKPEQQNKQWKSQIITHWIQYNLWIHTNTNEEMNKNKLMREKVSCSLKQNTNW